MDGVSAASSVIAIVDLSAKVASLLLQYSTAVKNAKDDIQRLLRELEPLSETLEGVRRLLDGPGGAKLETIQRSRGSLEGCASQLIELESKLTETLRGKQGNDSKSARLMSRFGIRALKWPFETKEVDSIVKRMERCRDSLAAALMVQTVQILNSTQNDVLSRLPNVASAAFDSYANEQGAQCHSQTRVELRREILEWAEKPDGKCIYWLNGMAGTGKSTISRTVAKLFSDKGYLGGSFFFKRGERDRGNAAQMFTTIACQLVAKEPKLAPAVGAALDQDYALPSKSLNEQFEKLILQPLESLKDARTLVFVFDALDECEGDQDVRRIIRLISKGSQLRSIRMRAFMTSRPELPIRLGFKDIQGSYQDLVLHQLPPQVIISDIGHFLKSELSKIREDYNCLSPGAPLPNDWPGSETVQELARMAIPLFVFAATACRFISDPVWSDPDGQLQKVLEYKSQDNRSGLGNLDATYRPVLDQLIMGSQTAQKSLVEEFQLVVGSIVLLEEPLPASSLSKLLRISRSIIDRRVMSLHSVLHVPLTDDPIRILHLSFRDFLIDPQKQSINQLWVDEKAVHKRLTSSCLKLLSNHPHFHKDLCELRHPGSRREDVPASVIRSKLPNAISYACVYWVEHAVKGESNLIEAVEVHSFLQKHFLHWLEALSFLDKVPESISMIRKLKSIDGGDQMAEFLDDADRFISTFKPIIAKCPLQTYSSALVFSPGESVIRRTFQHDFPKWIPRLPPVRKKWSRCLHTLETQRPGISYMSFTPDSKTIFASTDSSTIRSWNVDVGVENELKIDPPISYFCALSPDGRILASVLKPMKEILLFDSISGEKIRSFQLQGELMHSCLQFTPDSQSIFFTQFNGLAKALKVDTGEQILSVHISDISIYDIYASAVLSPNGTLVATNIQGEAALWSVKTDKRVLTIDAHHEWIQLVGFTPDGQSVTGVDKDGRVFMWNTSSGEEQLRVQADATQNLVFSRDGKRFVTASNRDVKLWDLHTASLIAVFRGHYNTIECVAISPNGERIASGGNDGTIRIWDATQTGDVDDDAQPGPWSEAITMCFSAEGTTVDTIQKKSDGKYLVTADVLGSVIGEAKVTADLRVGAAGIKAFSPYAESFLVDCPNGKDVLVVNKSSKKTTLLSDCKLNVSDCVAVSPDGTFVVYILEDWDIVLFDTSTGDRKKIPRAERSPTWKSRPDLLVISANCRLIGFRSLETKSVHIWDIRTGLIRDVTPDGAEVAEDLTVSFW